MEDSPEIFNPCSARGTVPLLFAPPPEQQLQPGAIRIGARNLLLQQIEMRGKPPPKLLPAGAKRWSLGIRNQVVDRQEFTAWLQPSECGLNVFIPSRGVDGAEQRVLEQPVKRRRWCVPEKIPLHETRRQSSRSRPFARDSDGGRGDIQARHHKSGFGPSPHVMSGSASRHTDSSLRQFGMSGQKIDQSGRRCALFPRHVAGSIAVFPVSFSHAAIVSHGSGRTQSNAVGGFSEPCNSRAGT